ncbi:MAG: nucleotidyl transferase AbiEii/AbiGii toxin family protein [Gemmatimonadaceae bacterium]
MPLTEFQRTLLATLAAAPTDDRYLAGGAALHFAPHSARYSDDLGFFHDSEARVASAFAADRARLTGAGCAVDVELSQPGLVRAIVRRGEGATRVDWAHDSAWRFLPLVPDALGGWLLHPVDLAVNKTLALAGRDEPRDFVDILYVHQHILPLAGLVWAAPGKDPGFSPLALLEQLRRRGGARPEEFARLQLAVPFDAPAAKVAWRAMLEGAETFARQRPPDEVGCLYYHAGDRRFALPVEDRPLAAQGLVPHFGAPGGVIPRVADARVEGADAAII